MDTFYFICILLLIHHESTYCESSSVTTKSSDTRTTAATTATSDARTTADTAVTSDTRTTADTTATVATRTIEYPLRLAHGKFGRVEIKMQNTWNYVCSNNFSDADARVVCRELGYKDGFPYLLSDPYRGERNPLISSLGCTGTEMATRFCSTGGNASNCDAYRSAAAYCYNNSGFDFRLTNVSTSGYGHIEMAVDGEWRPFCGLRNFDNNQRALDLVCQQMGFSNGTSSPRIKKNPVENIWVPYIYGCREGATLLMSCALILNVEEVPYDQVDWRNNRYRNEYYVCKEGYLPLIKCF